MLFSKCCYCSSSLYASRKQLSSFSVSHPTITYLLLRFFSLFILSVFHSNSSIIEQMLLLFLLLRYHQVYDTRLLIVYSIVYKRICNFSVTVYAGISYVCAYVYVCNSSICNLILSFLFSSYYYLILFFFFCSALLFCFRLFHLLFSMKCNFMKTFLIVPSFYC